MTNIYEIENRLLIPNWRDFNRTLKIGELGQVDKLIKPDINFEKVKFDWNNKKSIGLAADLIGNSFVAKQFLSKELLEAMEYVEENKKDASSSLILLIDRIKRDTIIGDINVKNSTIYLEKNIDSFDEFESLANKKVFDKFISKTKKLTRDYSRNAIYWVELARLYTIKAQNIQAEKCIIIALQLAPNNRFVLRSASRFFVHISEEDKALHYLKKSGNIQNDPWLISAHIAASSMINRSSIYLKKGREVVGNTNFSPYDLTELASSLGTIELKNGSFKKSKNLIEYSLISPNDNSLAQFEWLSKQDNRLVFNSNNFSNVINPFEAFSYEYFKNGEFEKSFENCIDWYLDMPFSNRPLIFGSYLATVLQQHDRAIFLCQIGLKYGNDDAKFINNLVYNYCLKGDIKNAELYLNKFFSYSMDELSNEEKITLQATIGLFHFKSNDIEKGKDYYEIALTNSLVLKNNYYYNLALINYCRELFINQNSHFKNIYKKFLDIKSEDEDVLLQKKQVEEFINLSDKPYILKN